MEKLQVIKHPQFGTLSVMIIDGKEMFKANECASMLGYAQPKDAISRHCKGAMFHRLPTKSGEQNVKFIPEGDLWRLIIRSKLPQAEAIEKWIMEEVLPSIRKTGKYEWNKPRFAPKTYEYFDKTYNGEPVLTSLDVEYLTGISRNNVDYHARHNLCNGKDYFLLVKGELKRFKIENPKVSRMASSIVIITQSGFIKLCQAYGVKIEQPKCFEVKENQQKSAVRRILDNFQKYYNIKMHVLTNEVAEILGADEKSLINESRIIRRYDDDKYQMFIDETAPLLEKQFMVAQNLGHILAGTLRKDADPDIDYAQEARTFAMVVMALSLYFDN